MPQVGAVGHPGGPGQSGDRERVRQVVQRPLHRAGDAVVLLLDRPDGGLDELGLAAVPVRRHNEAAGHAVGDLGAVVAPDQVQAEVDPGRAAGAGQHRSVVHVEHVRVDPDGRVALPQQFGVPPVGGGLLAVEQAGGGQGEGPGADRDDPGAALVRGAQRLDQGGGDHPAEGVRHAGDHHGVGGGEVVEAVFGGEGEAADRAERCAGAVGAHPQPVPGGGQQSAQLGPGQAEHLDHDAELERGHAVEGVDGDLVHRLRPPSDADGDRAGDGNSGIGGIDGGGGRRTGRALLGHGTPY